MEKRFADALEFRLDEVEDRRFAEVTWDELLRWYDRQRVTKAVWQDIMERWEERTEDPLLVYERRDSYILVSGEGITVSGDAWLKPVRAMAEGD
jgi:hypothetical protein